MTRRAARALVALVGGLLGAQLATGAGVALATPTPTPQQPATGVSTVGTVGTVVADEDRPLEVAVVGLAPAVLAPGEDLTVSVRVRNAGPTPVARPRVSVSLDRSAFVSRSSLDRWRHADPDAGVGVVLAQADLPDAIGPGQTATVDVVVPASEVRLPRAATSWGARGLAVTVVDLDDGARHRLGVARTFLLWFPPQEVNATRVSVLAPVVGPPVDPRGGQWVGMLDALTTDGGRLADLLDVTGDHRSVTWVLDPWLLAAATEAGPSTHAWADRFRAGLTDREVQLLPYLDPDVAALAHAEEADLLTDAVAQAESTARAVGLADAARVRLLLPPVDRPDLATAALAGQVDDLSLVVGPGALPPPVVLTYTPSGRARVPAGGRAVTVLVADDRLSTALVTGQVRSVQAGTADDDAGPGRAGESPGTVLTPATAAQDLLAELAVVTRERPNDSRHVLLSVPRTWAPDPDVARAQLAALESAPWVRTEPVSALIGLADPEIDRGALPAREVSPAEIDPDTVTALRADARRRAALARMVPEPERLLGEGELEVHAPLGVAWRADPPGRDAVVAAGQAATSAIADGVTVLRTTEVLNLISTSGAVPVQVRNDLDQPVDVTVGLRPSDPRLRAEAPVPVTVAPGSQALVQIPVHAVQSADISVTVEVRAPGGALVDADTSIPIRVRAEWEGIGTAVLGTLLALGLVIGLARTIRRGRTARRAAPNPEAGPDALSPEEVAERAEAAGEVPETAGPEGAAHTADAGPGTRPDERPAARPGARP